MVYTDPSGEFAFLPFLVYGGAFLSGYSIGNKLGQADWKNAGTEVAMEGMFMVIDPTPGDLGAKVGAKTTTKIIKSADKTAEALDAIIAAVKGKVDEVMNSGTVENMQNWVKNVGKNDPKAKPPGTEWRGTGEVGSTAGNYYDEPLGISMNPDLNHGPPKGPHWGYQGPDGKFDISPSGDLANKKN